MRTLPIILALLCGPVLAMDKAAMTEADAFQAIKSGQCGSLPLGIGLKDGKGWIHSPIPGDVQICMAGKGTVSSGLTPAANCITIDMRPGRLSPLVTHPATPGEQIIWSVNGFRPGPIPKGFQLPPL